MGYSGIMSSDYETSGLFRTFKTEKEFHEFVQGHSLPEERRLLWLGFMFGANHAVYKINKDLASKKKQIFSSGRRKAPGQNKKKKIKATSGKRQALDTIKRYKKI